ncbi:MAG: hypothetical protein WD066_07510, partial [Planctomycetaceae bacterium]
MTEPARKLTPSEFLAELKRQVAEKPLPDNGPPVAEFADLDFSDLADLPPGPDDDDAPAHRGNGTAVKASTRTKPAPPRRSTAQSAASPTKPKVGPGAHSPAPPETARRDATASNGKSKHDDDSGRADRDDRSAETDSSASTPAPPLDQ